MARDVVTLIEQDHRDLQQIFGRLRAGEGDRQLLFQQAAVLLAAHSRAEEAEVYPEVATVAGTGEVSHSREEHAEADQMVAQLKTMDPQSREFERLLHQMIDAVEHHIEEEESDALPALRRGVSKQRLAELAEAFAARRGAELTHGPSPRQVGGSELSRERLYERAQQYDIQGRSRMSKQELQRALADAGR